MHFSLNIQFILLKIPYIFYLTLTNCNTGIPICQHFFYVFQHILLIYPFTTYEEYDKSHSIHNLHAVYM